MRPDLARYIDHTLLRPDAMRPDLERLCEEGARHSFATVCVNSSHVALCTALLGDRQLAVASTIGFPLGAANTASKVAEARRAALDGAAELDMVCSISALKEGRRREFIDEIRRVRDAANGAILKVILETCVLEDDHKRRGAEWVREAGAAFVKTSTGFGSGGATLRDVELLRGSVGPDFGVKASGGIRDAATADAMIAAGADRLGTSAGVAIVTSSEEDLKDT